MDKHPVEIDSIDYTSGIGFSRIFLSHLMGMGLQEKIM